MIDPSTQSEYYCVLKEHDFVAGAKYMGTDGVERNLSPSMYDSPNFNFYIVFDNQRHIHPYVFDENIWFQTPKEMSEYLNLYGVFES